MFAIRINDKRVVTTTKAETAYRLFSKAIHMCKAMQYQPHVTLTTQRAHEIIFDSDWGEETFKLYNPYTA